ncbi:MAG: serine hydrolase [Phototrophicales bacterium]|nr:MAG: serine hydrolase [Phototrophicales bacterium]
MLETLLDQMMEQQQIPGMALAVHRGTETLLEAYRGWADLELSSPVNADTIFEIASVTKLFTAQAVLVLMERGQLMIDHPLADYMSGIPDAWRSVTIRHILAHQSGIPSYTDAPTYWSLAGKDKTFDEVIDLVRDLPLRFQPGARYAYDNTGYYLLGRLIEKVSGNPYGTWLNQTIFEPLNMSQTRVNDYREVIRGRARGYRLESGELVNKPYYSTSNTFSAGVLLSTVRDLLAWRDSLKDDRILSEKSRRLWWTLHPSAEGNERSGAFTLALGWFVVDSPLGQFYGHNGGIAGFASSLMIFPEADITAVLLCNAEHVSAPHSIVFDLLGRGLNALHPKPPI